MSFSQFLGCFMLFSSINLLLSYHMLNNVRFYNSSGNISNAIPLITPNMVSIFGNTIGFPTIDTNTGEYLNNGIPQLADYVLINNSIYDSLQNMDQIKGKFPSNYDGMLVFDFEDWIPSWDGLSSLYKNASYKFIQNMFPYLFPNINNSELQLLAKESWELNSMEIMLYGIQVCREYVPNASIGYYGYPGMPYWGNEKDFKKVRLQNDNMEELWANIDVLLPSIYIPYRSNGSLDIYYRNNNYVYRKIMESYRIKKKYNNKLLIYPYTMHFYHEPETGMLEYHEFLSEYNVPYTFKNYIDGIVLWGVINGVHNCELTMSWFEEYTSMFNDYV